MIKTWNNVQDKYGNAIVGAEVRVTNVSDGLPAAIFSDENGTLPLTQPILTNALGIYEFFAAPGDYTLTISAPGYTTNIVTDITVGMGDDAGYKIDLVNDTTYTDFGLRIIRNATANGSSDLIHRGTGPLRLQTQDAAQIFLMTSGINRFSIGSATYTANIGPGPGASDVDLTVGTGRNADGISRISLIGDATYTTAGLQLLRNAGANGGSDVISRGTGALRLIAQDAAQIRLLTGNVERVRIESNAHTLSVGPAVNTDQVNLFLGTSRTGDGTSAIGLIGDTTYSAGGLTLIRNSGANGNTTLTHRGTGAYRIRSQEAGTIDFLTSDVLRAQIAAAAHTFNIGPATTTETVGLDIAGSRSGNGQSQIQLIGDTTYTAGGMRLIRSGAGANSNSTLQHRGTGNLALTATEAAPIVFSTNNLQRLLLSASSYTAVFGGSATTEDVGIEIGQGRAGLGQSFIDLVTDNTTYTDYGLRIIRGNAVNANSEILHRGTGSLNLTCNEAGLTRFYNNTTNVMDVAQTGVTIRTGADFGSTLATGLDLSSHLALWGTTYGFNVSTGSLNMIAGAGGVIAFVTNGATTPKLSITTDGRIFGSALHDNAGSVTGTTNQYIASGTYTPTITNGANVAASTSAKCQWLRVGNVVTVSGNIQIDPTASGAVTVFALSLPIASNFTVASDLGGTGCASDTVGEGYGASADTVNDRASYSGVAQTTANHGVSFTFQYEVK